MILEWEYKPCLMNWKLLLSSFTLKATENFWFPSHHVDFEPEDIDINLPPSVKQPEQLASGMWLFQMGVFILFLFWLLEFNFLKRQEQCCAHLMSHRYTVSFALSEEENPFISFYFLPTMQSYSLIIETTVFSGFFKILACKVDVHSSFIKTFFPSKVIHFSENKCFCFLWDRFFLDVL